MIIQPQLELPGEMAVGIASGKLFLDGGVVRDVATGRLVKLLKGMHGAENGQEALRRSAAMLRSRGSVVATVLGTAIVAGAVTYIVVKKRKRAGQRDFIECVASLNASLRTYLEAGREGKVDATIISRLIADLDTVQARFDEGGSPVDFSTELWGSLISLVIDHTRRLAEAYSADLDDLDEIRGQVTNSENPSVIDLRRHLEIQRQIIGEAA
ncbi:hypothetical protein ACQP00_20700 [Dactylosporangium sp. CS-047395]|uniref:hypothetical protein n=1 Tax=Dactylosporangium sp. CS-047395 TaxID=3239936 RepID=UPI003D8BB735